jgi:hypothetical protein
MNESAKTLEREQTCYLSTFTIISLYAHRLKLETPFILNPFPVKNVVFFRG